MYWGSDEESELEKRCEALEEQYEKAKAEIHRLHEVCREYREEIEKLENREMGRRKEHKPYYLVAAHNFYRGTDELIGPGTSFAMPDGLNGLSPCFAAPEECYQTRAAAEKNAARWNRSADKANARMSYGVIRVNYMDEPERGERVRGLEDLLDERLPKLSEVAERELKAMLGSAKNKVPYEADDALDDVERALRKW